MILLSIASELFPSDVRLTTPELRSKPWHMWENYLGILGAVGLKASKVHGFEDRHGESHL